MLIIMSNRIRKQNKRSSEVVTIRKSSLLKAFSTSYSLDILSYNNYIVRRIQSYCISLQDSSYCKEYVLRNRSDCNVLNVLDKQLFYFASQHIKLKNEVQVTTERLFRLQNQKKIQFEKIIYIISRDLFDIKKLERVEIEEAVRVGTSRSEILLIYLSSSISEFLTFIVNQLSISSISLFSLGLFADLRILNIIETSSDIRLSF